ncbi:adenylate/guanylate cyclase domain-containing protein [Candidatus Parabeggiatoa sp. HSG14]|uniref:response regulator n=1 Tax=Candidatus Parabeggiatoa sp. HSG14 TaxID=3055593 RepID=UPI0025A693D6|nr:adenylate/guanylate cyclase domain-containing protein [Thiotrichales bacterium HSG14]
MAKKPTLFPKEEEVLKRTAEMIEQLKTQDIPFKKEYERLFKDYKKLFKQTKLLVKMSDQQQSQLTTLSEGLQSNNIELQHKAEEAEEAVRASEKRLAQFLEAMSIGVFVLDANGHPYYANQKAKQIFGKEITPSSSAKDLPEICQVYLADSTQLYPQEHQPIIQALKGKVSSVDDMEIHQSKKIIPIEVWGTPILDEQGNVAYAIAAFQDITERKQAEEERIHFTQELAELNQAYERFVPHQFLSLLDKKSVVDVQLGDQIEKEMTLLFSDIRGFTSLSEKMTPQENFNFINAYLSQMEPIVHKYQGVIDKYIGDAIMALFPTSADHAVQAAIDMLKALVDYNIAQKARYPYLKIGIGIHTGYLMLGTIGGQDRMDGTVISDAVNLASRIEDLTKTYDTPLLITEKTYKKLTDVSQYKIRMIDHVTVKGKSKSVTVYEVFDANTLAMIELKSMTLHDFEQGVKFFHNNQFEKSKRFFDNVLQINKNDKVAQTYFDYCQKILSIIMKKTPKILIVDDFPDNIRILKEFLIRHKFLVLIAKDGETALQIVEHETPHLILLDVMMSGMDGFETCRRLKANTKTQNIPLVFMTALSDSTHKIKGLGLGAVDYITKPFQYEEVLARIKTHLNIHHLQQLQAKNFELEIDNLELKKKINKLITQKFL